LAITRPNQVWCVDISYIPPFGRFGLAKSPAGQWMRHGFLYLVAIMDWYSRKVLSRRLSNSMEADFCVEALKEALTSYGKPEIMNSPSPALLRNTLPGSGSGQPVHRLRMDECADGRRCQNLDGRAWTLDRQSDDRKVMAISQIRQRLRAMREFG